MIAPKSVQATVDLKILKIAGTWEPDESEQTAAWELYVELVTRVGFVPLHSGLSREALNSLYSLFQRTREILIRNGPSVSRPKADGGLSFGFLAIGMLNVLLRPFLSYWHPELAAWENRRSIAVSVQEHERSWNRDLEFRQALADLGTNMQDFVTVMADACDVPNVVRPRIE